MKKRITLSIENELLDYLDQLINQDSVKNRSELVEKVIKTYRNNCIRQKLVEGYMDSYDEDLEVSSEFDKIRVVQDEE